jgi:hypothetical protein
VGFSVSIEFARVETIRFLAFDGAKTLAGEAFARALDGGAATVQRVSDFRLAPAFAGFQQDTCSGEFLGAVVAN